ncbi:hypothetical protein SASPL_157526 [Salvia splendens]|uniref:Cu2+-exporting ATPase n=1 Tax=Salvia splendens TaxID=180675 RepID=A0A8X8VUS6_SALSN|nr:hypothetical protein SASPL_157526 [Salvia splendens]
MSLCSWLATPTAVLVGTSLGAKKGLLLRGGSTLERFSGVNTIVFDKTGTLTIGRPVVKKILVQDSQADKTPELSTEFCNIILLYWSSMKLAWLNSNGNWSEVDILKLAAGVESSTIHPIGKAIVEAAKAQNCLNVKVAQGTFFEEPGSGAVATVDKKKVAVGTMDWVQRHGVVGDSPFQEAEEFKNQSVVYVGIDGILAGVIYVEDQIREDARHVIESLTHQGINTYLLSGDKRSAAEYVASAVGIPKNRVLYGVKPDEKKNFISKLQEGQNVVAMVGDGINDAAALASSHVGIAIGGGVGAASEVSSIVLMQNRLSQFHSTHKLLRCELGDATVACYSYQRKLELLDALELSRLTMKTVKQNLWWAFAYNIVGIPVAAGTLLPVTGTMLSPSIAGALMGLSSIGVMSNSILLRWRFKSIEKDIHKLPLYVKAPLDAENTGNGDARLQRPY